MSENKQANEMREATIADIVAALRKCGDEWVGDMSMVYMEGAGCFASYLADCLEAAMRRERKELVDAVREATGGMCLHCDMQQACAEGEDGMPTTCNAMARVRNFIETYETHDEDEGNNDECPF